MKIFNPIFTTVLALMFSHSSTNMTLQKSHVDIVQEPIRVEWNDLESIEYQMRYFKSYDVDMNTPVFDEKQKALDGKRIIITGFVIPLEENTELLSLSANPYASCFFCGNASPASVMSLYMKDSGKRYMVDDFKTFTGTLRLNYDNPDEFIYYLENAEEVSE
jgi:hypothetical protein